MLCEPLAVVAAGWEASAAHDGQPWAAEWLGVPLTRHVVFGHDAQRRLQLCKYATGVPHRRPPSCTGLTVSLLWRRRAREATVSFHYFFMFLAVSFRRSGLQI